MTCATCAHGKHMRAKSGESLGFVACAFGDPWIFLAGRLHCRIGKWKAQTSSAPQAPEAARPRAAIPVVEVSPADAERDAEDRRLWETT